MKSNIALIGFMGTGKSEIGRVLAGKLGWRFVEVDQLVEEMAGKTITEIFRQDGEITFREMEIEATRRVSQGIEQVISCGGGIVLNKINTDRLKDTSRMVYLIASPRTILERTSKDSAERPLLDVPDPAQRIRELLKSRRPFYEQTADIIIDTSKLSSEAAADHIINRLKEDESFDLRKQSDR
ncbi:MAG: shikimate kinase [Dehalococcoidales bacterium]|nr:MAG: shikimate kinase [Dehalococcoidales bacterium]